MEDLTNDNIPFEGDKLRLLERIIACCQSGDQSGFAEAQSVLDNLRENTNFWVHTQSILAHSSCPHTVIFTLSTLQSVVAHKWAILDKDSQTSIRNFILETIVKWSSLATPTPLMKTCLKKANSVLVEIVKKEWTTTWHSAVSFLVQSSYQNELICLNNLRILKELSSEVFDYERKNMTSEEVGRLKEEFVREFESVFGLCTSVAKSCLAQPQAAAADLSLACLDTLHAFLSWMPPFYVLTTDLVEGVLLPLLNEKRFSLKALGCFDKVFKIEIPSVGQDPQLLEGIRVKVVRQFGFLVDALARTHDVSESLEAQRLSLTRREYRHLNFFQQSTQGFAVATSNFFATHLEWLLDWVTGQEAHVEIVDKLRQALSFMAACVEVRDPILFKNCIDFWLFLLTTSAKPADRPVLSLGYCTREQVLQQFGKSTSDMVVFLVTRVPKPQDIRVVIDEQGLPKKEEVVDSENAMLFEVVRDILRLYARDHAEAVQAVLGLKLEMEVGSSQWSYQNLNSMCWAIGCLADLKRDSAEKGFFSKCLISLIRFCGSKIDIEDKIVICTNIMHIITSTATTSRKQLPFSKWSLANCSSSLERRPPKSAKWPAPLCSTWPGRPVRR
jgi:exportin-1